MFEFLSDLVDAVIDFFDDGTPDTSGTSPSGTADAPTNDSSHEVKFGAAAGCDCGYNPNTCGAGWACRWQY
ncbi:hypothetical protein ACWEPN_24590 [Nonomuraea wenchangensis]